MSNKVARHFCHMLRRQSSLNQLFGTVRLALHDPQVNSILLHDWQRQDLHALTKSALQAAANFNNQDSQQFRKRRSEAQLNPATVEFVAACKCRFISFFLFFKEFNNIRLFLL